MRVLYVNSVCGKGSTGKIVEQLADAVIAGGGEALVCYGRNGYEGVIPSFRFCSDNANKINALMQRIFDNEGLGLRSPTKKLIKKIKEFNPDVIHLHNLHGYYLNYKLLFEFLAKSKIKVVWTLHDCWAFSGHCAYFDFSACNKWETGCYNCPNKKEYPKSLLSDNSKKQYKLKKQTFLSLKAKQTIIVSPSNWLDNLVSKSFLKEYKHIVLNNGIDTDIFKRTDNHSFDKVMDRSKKIVLAVAGNWCPRKGYNDVIKIAEGLDDEYKVVMVGVSDKQFEELKDTDITAIKRTSSQTELAELYSMAYCFINTTYEDNYPTVNLEALACGCPVITYDTGGSVEPITEENGIIVEQGNIEEMLAAIQNSIKTDTKSGVEADDVTNYDNLFMVNNYIKLYNELLTGD